MDIPQVKKVEESKKYLSDNLYFEPAINPKIPASVLIKAVEV
jgi:hypothetical protein